MTNTFWRDAAKGGLIIGGIVSVIVYLKTWMVNSGFESPLIWIFALIEPLAVAYFLYRMCRRRSMLYSTREGYSYGKNMSFVMAVMLFAGFIYGAALYFLYNFVMPDYVDRLIYELATNYMIYDDEMAEVMGLMIRQLFAAPFFMVFYGIWAMVISGGIIGLIVSIFVKRKPDVFASGQQD